MITNFCVYGVEFRYTRKRNAERDKIKKYMALTFEKICIARNTEILVDLFVCNQEKLVPNQRLFAIAR